jgi:ADP-heptose:LPS heptosyltransferase/glycosyltransferase involved in cell wall biosynthesis
MAKCPFCSVDVKEWDRKVASHLIVTKDAEDGAMHTHGPIESAGAMKELINSAKEVVSLTVKDEQLFNFKEIIFHNRQRIGDMIMFTCAVRDFKQAFPNVKVNVISTAMHIWDYNPAIDSSVKPYYNEGKTLETITPADFLAGRTNVLKIGPGWLTNKSNRIDWHFANAYRCSIEQALNINIPQGESRGDIWMTQEEYDAPRIFKQPYWLIVISGEKGWGCKMYPYEKWQKFVSQNPDTTFVQLGTNGDNPPRLQGANVIDYVGKTEDRLTGCRDLFKLFLNAEGSISLVSFAMHLSGALYKPAVVIAGAREPVSFTQYHGHRYLANDGCHPCSINACWHCDINTCPTLNEAKEPLCVQMINPEDITQALNQYYIGGRLKKGIPSEKPKQFKNIVKTPAKVIPVEVVSHKNEIKQPTPVDMKNLPNTDGFVLKSIDEKSAHEPTKEELMTPTYLMTWGNSSIWQEDWQLLKKLIDEYKVEKILEFGAGLSTVILNELKVKVVTYENEQKWADAVKKISPKADIHIWDGKYVGLEDTYDMAFVDGPRAYGSAVFGRQYSIEAASKVADIVVVHDATRPGELLWQETHLRANYELVFKGGKWDYVYVWIKKGYTKKRPIVSSITPVCVNRKSKFVKLVSTARGWGGCARSITTIMKFLLQAGHKVEFIPFRNNVGSHEFKQYIGDYLQGLQITTAYNTLREACDVLFVYADDYVWEFGTPEMEEAFSNIQADKKVMMLNYRRGNVGQIEWTKGWDKYMFLNSNQEKELLKLLPNVKTKVLPPCVELEEFLKVKPDFTSNLRLVRVSSQGDTKFDKDNFANEVQNVLNTRLDLNISFLPGPSFIKETDRIKKVGRTDKAVKIAEFLATGNLFWYSLPKGYMDMGPRVVLEAMASGLPILADNWGGVVDRVTPECGWLCNTKEEMVKVIEPLSPDILKKKGEASKQRAREEFVPQKWIEEILS